MRCPSCKSFNIKEYGDELHWQCKDCHWIFIKERSKEKIVVKKVLFDEEELWV